MNDGTINAALGGVIGPGARGTMRRGLVVLVTCAVASAQEPQPYLHFTRTAGATVQTDARFGYSAAAGRLETIFDELGDIVTCAIDESYDGKTQVGAAYVFVNDQLSAPSDLNKQRLEPANPVDMQEMGRLVVEIGNPRGPGFTNLIFIAAFGTTAKYCNGTQSVPLGGSVEVFDVNDGPSFDKPVLSLVAPPNPGGGPCRDTVPDEVRYFGHAIALEDITLDGIDDVIVGALGTDVGIEASLGRIYIFAGQASFISSPHTSWIGLNAPESSDSQDNSGVHFGFWLDTADLHQGSPNDVAVGRPDRTDDAEGQPEGGTVVVFRGSYLNNLFSAAPNIVSNPAFIEDVEQQQTPDYQILPNPFGDYQLNCVVGPNQNPLYCDAYGWNVFSVGDVGSPFDANQDGFGDFDGIDDIIVHAEATDWIGHSTACNPDVLQAGALFVYYGTGNATGPDIVHPEHVLLMTPGNVNTPEDDARLGRSLARVDLLLDDGDPLTIDVPQPALVIGEPDRTVDMLIHAGQVYLVRLPLPLQPTNGWDPAPIENAWGTTPMTEPGGAVAEARFGAMIMGLNYLPTGPGAPNQPGQQLFISARSTTVTVGSPPTQTTYIHAGKFFTFTPYPPPP